MDLTIPDSMAELRAELRDYFARLVPPEVEAELELGELGGDTFRRIYRTLGEDGWLGIGWPKEFGGQGRGSLEQFVFFDEADRAAVPVPFLTIKSIGPMLMDHGTPAQQAEYLPAILEGKIHFSIGYTEPDSGTDLASLRTAAYRDGDEYVISGQKIFTSYIGDADYIWLAARTGEGVKKHHGISILIVPRDAVGLSVTPIEILPGTRTYATYYDDVRVPVGNLVGEEGKGWGLIMGQLNYERVAMSTPGRVERSLRDVTIWAQHTDAADGRKLIEHDWVKHKLARVHVLLELLRFMNWQVAWHAGEGSLNPADASATKVFGSEAYNESYQLLFEVTGALGGLRSGSAGAVVDGRVENEYRIPIVMTFGGGTNEVQRDLISGFGLGLPVSRT